MYWSGSAIYDDDDTLRLVVSLGNRIAKDPERSILAGLALCCGVTGAAGTVVTT